MTYKRLPKKYTIPDLIAATGDRLTDRQVRHWLQQGWCLDVEHVAVGGRIHTQWQWGSSGWVHAQEMAWLTLDLGIAPKMASEIASSLLLSGEYVTDHYSIYATERNARPESSS